MYEHSFYYESHQSENHVNGFKVIDLTTTIMRLYCIPLTSFLLCALWGLLTWTIWCPTARFLLLLFCTSKPSPSISFYPIGEPMICAVFSGAHVVIPSKCRSCSLTSSMDGLRRKDAIRSTPASTSWVSPVNPSWGIRTMDGECRWVKNQNATYPT